MKYYYLILFFIQILNVLSPIPNWDISQQANLLDVSTNEMNYTIYDKTAYDIRVVLNKRIAKSGTQIITQNYLLIYDQYSLNPKDERAVEFEDIDSHYTSKLGYDILICPKGKFHPYDFKGKTHINAPSGFQDKGGWDLRCYDHKTEYFYIFYLLNDGSNFFYKYNGGITQRSSYIYSYFYDFLLENGEYDNTEYKFCVLRYDGANGGVIRLCPEALKTNKGNGDVNKVSKGSTNDINSAKNKVQAYFDSNKYFYYFTYNDASDFESGYSKKAINYNDFSNTVSNPEIVKKTDSPLTFADNVEIQVMNFISGTKYVYYKIHSISKNKNYFGLLDIVENKILYNIEAEFNTFIPASTSSTIIMLGITDTNAYQICITKNSASKCINDCSSASINNLILDESGNKCQANCDNGKIKLMPEGYCINTESCDLNIYELNSDGTECGLCKYINSNSDAQYKFINTRGCINITSLPTNAEYYNEKSKLLQCKTNHHLNNGECIPDFCFERCQNCSSASNDINDQKCLSCNPGYILDDQTGNCNEKPTTIIIPPSTMNIPPTTAITPPTTVIKPPTTLIIPPTTVLTSASTGISETEIIRQCRNERCLKCSAESDNLGLCLSCNETKYKKVNYTKFPNYYDCFEEKELQKRYYYDEVNRQYKPCFELCNKCLGPGNATDNNCLECKDNYMFRPGDNPKNNCVVYSEYYYLSAYGEYKPLDNPNCPEEAKYIVKDENKIYCIYDCKEDKSYKFLYNGNCLKECPIGTSDVNNNKICKETDPNKIYISNDPFYLKIDKNNKNNPVDTMETIKTIEALARAVAPEFSYNHISSYSNEDYSILLYKSPKILSKTNINATDIDFGECYEEIKKAYNITTDLLIAVGDVKVINNPTSFYLFFHPDTGLRLEVGDLCNNKNIQMK